LIAIARELLLAILTFPARVEAEDDFVARANTFDISANFFDDASSCITMANQYFLELLLRKLHQPS
jgi:hypothetical protein